jgi:leucyl-tRNA synthetase
LIAKGGKVNPFLLLKFIETQLVLINPICPHYADYCWETHVRPILEKSKNLSKAPPKLLINHGWPTPSKEFDPIARRMLEYMKSVKSHIR